MKQDKAIVAIMSKDGATVEIYKGLTIIEHAGPSVCIFQDRKSKPIYYYKFKTEELRTAFITDQKNREDSREQQEIIRQQNAKIKAEQIQEGAILYSSWGWEQTNINFYKVIDRKGQLITIVEVGQIRDYEENDMSGNCIPDPDRIIGEPIKKRIAAHGGINLNSYSWCGLWDGKPKGWTSWA